MKKNIIIILLACFIKASAVETNTFSLNKKVEHLIEQLKTANKAGSVDATEFKKYLIKKLELFQEEKRQNNIQLEFSLSTFFSIAEATQIKGTGAFIKELALITNENIKQYSSQEEHSDSHTRKFALKWKAIAPKKTPVESMDKAIEEVIKLVISRLSSTQF